MVFFVQDNITYDFVFFRSKVMVELEGVCDSLC